MPSSRGSSQLRDRTQVSHIAGGFFNHLSHQGNPKILEWVSYPFSRGTSWPRNRTRVSCIADWFFTSWTTREAQEYWSGYPIPSPVDLPGPGIKLGSPALPAELPMCGWFFVVQSLSLCLGVNVDYIWYTLYRYGHRTQWIYTEWWEKKAEDRTLGNKI